MGPLTVVSIVLYGNFAIVSVISQASAPLQLSSKHHQSVLKSLNLTERVNLNTSNSFRQLSKVYTVTGNVTTDKIGLSCDR